jgi:hypothetical protein
MKKNIPLIISFLVAIFSSVSAQDTVVSANVEQIEVNVLTADNGQYFESQTVNEIDSAALPFIAKKEFYKINDKAMLQMMSVYAGNADIYSRFSKGVAKRKFGFGVLTGGVLSALVGTALIIDGLPDDGCTPDLSFDVGMLLSTAGGVLIIIGLPPAIVGSINRHKAKDAFYDKYFSGKQSTYTPTLQLKLVPNGVGLALNF